MILVVASHVDGKLSKSTGELVGAARELGREGPVAILLLGSGIAAVANESALLADQVLVADRLEFENYNPEIWAFAVAEVARKIVAHTVLIPASRAGREYSPRVAVRLDAALVENVSSLKYAAGAYLGQRGGYLSRVVETIETTAAVAVITVKPGAFATAKPRSLDQAAKQMDVVLDLPSRRVEVTRKNSDHGARVALADAEVIVSGGRGLGSADGFTRLIEPLAVRLGAAIGATRAVVDAGWRPYSEQIGQTGKTVGPRVYLAVGISGAVQHLSGMNKSTYIIAVNKDPDAPIFKACDLGIIGDVNAFVPALLDALGPV